jgi:hypothetical protein
LHTEDSKKPGAFAPAFFISALPNLPGSGRSLPGNPHGLHAHASAPPNGENAHLAMLDGAELGLALAGCAGHIEEALSRYEAAMFARSAKSASDGAELHAMLASENPATRMAAMFAGD